MSDWRWIAKDGFEYFGDETKLREALANREVGLSSMVWRDGQRDWVPLGSTPEFAPPKTMPFASPSPLPEPAPFRREPELPTLKGNAPPEPPPPPQRHPSAPPPAAYAPAAHSAPPPAQPKKKSGLIVIIAAVGGAFVLGSLALMGVITGNAAKKVPEAPAASASAGPAEPKAATACQAEAPKRLAKTVFGRVQLEVVEAENKLGVAFAETDHVARIITVDPETLSAEAKEPTKSDEAILGVVIAREGKEFNLTLDVKDPDLRSSHTVVATPPFAVGSTKQGIGRRMGEETKVIWPGDEKPITVPRVETLPDTGHVVALRRGTNELLCGWLTLDGDKKSDLEHVPFESHALGTPALAAGPKGFLVMVAARNEGESPWQIAAGHAGRGEIPKKLELLPLGDDKNPRISPSAVSLASGQWAIQWTTGPADSHIVNVALFDASLKRATDPTAVSPQGSDAGQGVLWSDGSRIVSFFLVSTGKSHELWAARVKCT